MILRITSYSTWLRFFLSSIFKSTRTPGRHDSISFWKISSWYSTSRFSCSRLVPPPFSFCLNAVLLACAKEPCPPLSLLRCVPPSFPSFSWWFEPTDVLKNSFALFDHCIHSFVSVLYVLFPLLTGEVDFMTDPSAPFAPNFSRKRWSRFSSLSTPSTL